MGDLSVDLIGPSMAADACNNTALIEWKLGNLASASAQFAAALRLRHKVGDKFGTALSLQNLAIMEENMGRYSAAERHYRQAIELAEAIQFRQVLTAAHANLANLYLARDSDATRALEHSARALAVAKEIGDRRSAAIALENLALASGLLKRFPEAAKCLREARAIAADIGDLERLLSVDLAEIEVDLEKGGGRKLLGKIRAAGAAIDERGFESERPRCLRLLARVQMRVPDHGEAISAAHAAMAEARRQQSGSEERRVRTLLQELQSPGRPA